MKEYLKKYQSVICIAAAVCLLGAAAFCGFHVYDHYAHQNEQTEAFEEIAQKVEQAQEDESQAPEIPLTEEESILPEYGELFLQNPDMVGWIKVEGTNINYPVMQTPNEPNFTQHNEYEVIAVCKTVLCGGKLRHRVCGG